MNPTLSAMFPNASKSCRDANPGVSSTSGHQVIKISPKGILKPRRGKMNNTEIAYALILRGMFERGEILRYEFEGITLRWADMRYTPDFIVFQDVEECEVTNYGIVSKPLIKLIEVKGGHIWDRDIVRFKGARAYWPEFAFEMHQKKAGSWKRIH